VALALGLQLMGLMAAAPVDEAKLPPAATNKIEFLRDIKPIFDAQCLKCHGPEKPKSGFRLDQREAVLKGGENGVAVIPGQSAKSPLIHYVARLVEDMEMPPPGKGEPLTAEQVGRLRAWIDQNLPWEGAAAEPAVEASATPALRWMTVQGNEQKFRELNWYREGWDAGLSDFLIRERTKGDGILTVSGHGMRDDYRVLIVSERPDGLFVRAGFQQFRKYYDDSGGYMPQPFTAVTNLGRDLHLDVGDAFIEAGGTTPFGLRLTSGYEYHYKDGDKSLLQWLPVQVPTPDGSVSILPNYKHIEEHRHVLRLDAAYDWRQTQLQNALRYEFYDLNTRRPMVTTLAPFITANQRMAESSESRNLANAFQAQVTPRDWLLLSAGYLFSHTDGEDGFRQTSVDANGAPATGQTWNGQGITLEQSSHVFNGNVQLGLWEGMTFSSGVQTEWSRTRMFDLVHLDLFFDPLEFANTNRVKGSYDRMTAEEKFVLRNMQIPYTVIYGEARFRQERIDQFEELSPAGAGFPTASDFLRETAACYDWKQYRVGFHVSPWTRVAWQAYAQRRDREDVFDHSVDQRPPGPGNPGNGYPAFITQRQTMADELGTKLVMRPASWLKTTLGFRVATTDYETVTDSTPAFLGNFSTPGGQVLAGEYDSHVYSVGAAWTPWRRLYIYSTFEFQDSRTVTEDHDNASIVPFRGHTYSALVNARYVLNPLTDLSLGYDFSYADYGQNNAPDGVPLGIDFRRHGIRAGIARKFLKRFTANLEYICSLYDEPSSGHYTDFTAHGVFAALTARWN
jgi:mono/diheme cytochrome c family protein